MTELIVALDSDRSLTHVLSRLIDETPINFFKLSAWAMLDSWRFDRTVILLDNHGCDWFADLKVYDTRDTVERVVGRAFNAGARFVTVHATPSMLEAAMRAKPDGDRYKIIAVASLTDNPESGDLYHLRALRIADGLICSHLDMVRWYRREYPEFANKLLVLPGVRPNDTDANNHQFPATPAEARRAGTDYVVVGRPIYEADDPVAVVRGIMAELDE